MQVFTGTSGFAYKEWKGAFYPDDLPQSGFLRYYATRLSVVEINNTFYRMPTAAQLAKWAAEVPESFVFVLKVSQRITHMKRLKDCGEEVAYFLKTAAGLGPSLGPLLFQLPPYLKKDAPRLRAFLELLPAGTRAAFEFRNPSWFDEETYAALRDRGVALCIADTDESPDEGPPIVVTGGFGYLRLRRADYDEAALRAWAARVHTQPWDQAFVFFKHEDAGKGAQLAERFAAMVGRNTSVHGLG
jgi:uncharacterized protein YecE (DUF72 family)